MTPTETPADEAVMAATFERITAFDDNKLITLTVAGLLYRLAGQAWDQADALNAAFMLVELERRGLLNLDLRP